MAVLLKSTCLSIQTGFKFLYPSVETVTVFSRGKHLNPWPRKRHPIWLPKQTRVGYNEHITLENKEFIQEIVESRYQRPDIGLGTGVVRTSPLKVEPIEPKQEWTESSRRTGVIAKKIGIYPIWLKDGSRVLSTLLQVVDNHVIKYIPPEEYNPIKHKRAVQSMVNLNKKYGCLVVGSEGCDPQKFTKEYCGLFNNSGVMPKRVLTRFLVTPDAALQPGTPLYAAHFKPGEVVDIRGVTIDRGFQGVCKRWGFKGGPASHGNTKTHRRPGNIGGGGEKGRVWPGTKMPGHMGNDVRILRGVKILRVNTKYNVIWVLGQALPGGTNSTCFLYDTLLPRRKLQNPPHFPTYLPYISEEPLPEEMYSDEVHAYNLPSIEFLEDSK
ncbi:39S ribosomal protein L3, mitochondrial [Athalia rosae]|uniref:39S ribosomal protein L3, mitochondrial n=1 Tax=Athalia rosae TaxID=37344 RepID=UPI002033BEE0|nr:39S ribosomal protein L3, mitochondrial [Athalia rosae]